MRFGVFLGLTKSGALKTKCASFSLFSMFTSRAEYRLSLRADNADLRLTRKGFEAGVVSLERLWCLDARQQLVSDGLRALQNFRLPTAQWQNLDESGTITFSRNMNNRAGKSSAVFETTGLASEAAVGKVAAGAGVCVSKTAHDVLSMPNVELVAVERVMQVSRQSKQIQQNTRFKEVEEEMKKTTRREEGASNGQGGNEGAADQLNYGETPRHARDTLQALVKYSKYLERQEAEIKHWRRNQELEIPLSIEYEPEVFPCLSSEELEKLQYTRPRNFQEASQISGLTPHSLVYLYQQVRKGKVCG